MDVTRGSQIRGVYKGALGPLLGQGFVSSFQFGIYNVVKPHFTTVRAPAEDGVGEWAWWAAGSKW